MIIQSKRVWIGGKFIPAQINIIDKKIENIYPYDTKKVTVDYGDKRIVPGFIDIHTHGAYGYDTNDGIEEGLRNWIRRIPEEGVTGILPTTVTQKKQILGNALRSVSQVVSEGYEGAEILGVHFEGPYLDMDYKGAQPSKAIRKPDIDEFKYFQKCAKGLIKYITLAPEHDDNHDFTRYLVENGVVVSMGHSAATFEEALLAVANGVSSMTHVYNGMTPYHHRKIGLVGAALRIKDIYGEIIVDGCHSSFDAVNNFFNCKGRDYGILITDSLRVKGCPKEGEYTLGGNPIEVGDDGLARIKGTNTIAGSTLKMNMGLKNLVEEAMVPFDVALNACTINPAKVLRVDNRKGKICAKYDADIVVLNDDYSVMQTYCLGKEML